MASHSSAWEKVLSTLSTAFIISGILVILLSGALLFQRYNPYRLSFDFSLTKKPISESIASHALPTHISISGSTISLPIITSTIKNKTWETTNRGVSYLDLSPIPGSDGNSILYGHNWTNLLGPLVKVKPGQKIRIDYSDGTHNIFVVEGTALVSPKDTSILQQSKESLLTIYTCAGFMDSKRFVVTAKKA